MLRHLNATNRKTISPQNYSLTLHKTVETASPHFNLTLNLGKYNFPDSANICVEAWRGNVCQRWNVGTVGFIDLGDDASRRLKELPISARFRITVISNETHGLILGETKPVTRSFQPSTHQSFLPVQFVDNMNEIWRVDHGNSDDVPVLQLNRRLRNVEDQIGKPTSFLCLTILPAVLRTVLTRFLLIENNSLTESEPEQAMYQWLNFSNELVPYDNLLDELENESDIEQRHKELSSWIESVVEHFAETRLKLKDHVSSVT